MYRIILISLLLTARCQSQPVTPSVPHAAPLKAKIVFDGNSLTAVGGAQPLINWPQQVRWLLNDQSNAYANVAVSGQTISQALQDTAANSALYDAAKDRNILIVMFGTNSIAVAADSTSAYDSLAVYCNTMKGTFKVYLLTCIPRWGSIGIQALNRLIRANWASFADVLVDVCLLPELDDPVDAGNSTYYVDGVHCTEAGYRLIANEVYKSLRANE